VGVLQEKSEEKRPEKKDKGPKPPKQPIISDFQFYPKRLHELLEREVSTFSHITYIYPLSQSQRRERN
jgi:hypothetical protein